MEIKQENASELRDLLFETINNAPNVTETLWVNFDEYGFSRELMFVVGEKVYKILWMWNRSELYFDEHSFFSFDRVVVDGTWPNHFKTNLQFYLGREPVGIIPLLEY